MTVRQEPIDVAAWRKAMEGVTPGDWSANGRFISAIGGVDTCEGAVHATIITCDHTDQSDGDGRNWSTSGSAEQNATWIARCSPAGIATLLEALSSQSLSLSEAREEIERLKGLVAGIREIPQEPWQDIATAPKDGRELIGYRPDQGVFVFRWAWMEEFVPANSDGDPIEDYDDTFACWWHDRWGWMEREETPTLWQPLPSVSPQKDNPNV